MKKRTLLILATAALLPALTACAPYDYSDRLSEVRSDLFIAQTEEFTLTLACVEREYPYADDGVPCPMTKTAFVCLSDNIASQIGTKEVPTIGAAPKATQVDTPRFSSASCCTAS